MSLLNPNQSYTFSKIFELKPEVEKLIQEFGYSLRRTRLNLPLYSGEIDRFCDTQNRIEELLPYVNLANETARREVLIAPVVVDVVHYTRAQLRIEYPIKVTEQLQGLPRSEMKAPPFKDGDENVVAPSVACKYFILFPNRL